MTRRTDIDILIFEPHNYIYYIHQNSFIWSSEDLVEMEDRVFRLLTWKKTDNIDALKVLLI